MKKKKYIITVYLPKMELVEWHIVYTNIYEGQHILNLMWKYIIFSLVVGDGDVIHLFHIQDDIYIFSNLIYL